MKIKIPFTNDQHDLDQLRLEAAKAIASEKGIDLENALASIKRMESKGLIKFDPKRRKVTITRPGPRPFFTDLGPRVFLVIVLVMATVLFLKGREVQKALQSPGLPREEVLGKLVADAERFMCHDPKSEACTDYQKLIKDLKERLDEGR